MDYERRPGVPRLAAGCATSDDQAAPTCRPDRADIEKCRTPGDSHPDENWPRHGAAQATGRPRYRAATVSALRSVGIRRSVSRLPGGGEVDSWRGVTRCCGAHLDIVWTPYGATMRPGLAAVVGEGGGRAATLLAGRVADQSWWARRSARKPGGRSRFGQEAVGDVLSCRRVYRPRPEEPSILGIFRIIPRQPKSR